MALGRLPLFCALALAVLAAGPAAAGEGDPPACRHYVYVIDVSESMIGQCSDQKCVDVFDDVMRGLEEAVTQYLTLPARVSVYTYYNRDRFWTEKSFELAGPGPEVLRLVEYVRGLSVKPPPSGERKTHLNAALTSVVNAYGHDPACPANLYLLTDGIDNSGQAKRRLDEFKTAWGEKTGDWLFFIDLYAGGNQEFKTLCADPQLRCSYHPIDPRDRDQVISCFCVPSIGVEPAELDFGNLLVNPEPSAKLVFRRDDACLRGRRGPLAFAVASVAVDDFPDPSWTASVSPAEFSAGEAAALALGLNRPVAELPDGAYHGRLQLRATDLRYQLPAEGKLKFKFRKAPPVGLLRLPEASLGDLQGKRAVKLEVDFSEVGPTAKVVPRLVLDPILEGAVSLAEEGPASRERPEITVLIRADLLEKGAYSFRLELSPKNMELRTKDGRPAPAELTFEFTRSLPPVIVAPLEPDWGPLGKYAPSARREQAIDFDFAAAGSEGRVRARLEAGPELGDHVRVQGEGVADAATPRIVVEVDAVGLDYGDYRFALVLDPEWVRLTDAAGKDAAKRREISFTVPAPAWLRAARIAAVVAAAALALGLLWLGACRFLPEDHAVKGALKDLKLCRPKLVGSLEAIEGAKAAPLALDGRSEARLGPGGQDAGAAFPAEVWLMPVRSGGRDWARVDAKAPEWVRLLPRGGAPGPAAGERLYHGDRLAAGGVTLEYLRPDGLEREGPGQGLAAGPAAAGVFEASPPDGDAGGII